MNDEDNIKFEEKEIFKIKNADDEKKIKFKRKESLKIKKGEQIDDMESNEGKDTRKEESGNQVD